MTPRKWKFPNTDHLARLLVVLALAWTLIPNAWAVDWDERFRRQVAECEAIPDDAYQTGLLFNPAGRRTYFERSRCLQAVAVEWRDANLCARVKQRRSLFFSGYAISEKACRDDVAEQLASDRAAADTIRVEDIHRLGDVRFERNGNGSDFDVRIQTTGSHPGSYQIRIEVWLDDASKPVVIDDYRQPLGSNGSSLSHFIQAQQVRDAFGNRSLDREVRVRITLELPPRSHADQFVLILIPAEKRRSSSEARVNFANL